MLELGVVPRTRHLLSQVRSHQVAPPAQLVSVPSGLDSAFPCCVAGLGKQQCSFRHSSVANPSLVAALGGTGPASPLELQHLDGEVLFFWLLFICHFSFLTTPPSL